MLSMSKHGAGGHLCATLRQAQGDTRRASYNFT